MFKKMRKKAGLTQQEAGKRLGVHQSTVALWEAGKTLPRGRLLKEVAKLYGCSEGDLLEEV